MNFKKFIILCVCFLCSLSMASYDEIEKTADAHYTQAKSIKDKTKREMMYAAAAEEYWQAAIKGSPTAVDKLSIYYNRFKTAGSYNWGMVSKYVQAASNAEYKRLRNFAQKYDGILVVIASEDAIIAKLGVNSIKKKYLWGGNKRCSNALRNLYRNFFIEIGNEKLFVRSQYMGKKLGNVAIIDRATAEKNFNIPYNQATIVDWCVFVISPIDKMTLIPFDVFYKEVYESKITAFIDMCRDLGAKRVEVYYHQKDESKTDIGVNIAVDGPVVKGYAGAKQQVDVAIKNKKSEHANVFIEFSGSSIVKNPKSRWIATETTWQNLKDGRRDKFNNVMSYDATFSYNENRYVNVATKTELEKAGFKIGFDVKTKFEDFKAINWAFKVIFEHKALIILP